MPAALSILQRIESQFLREDALPEFRPGDTVRVEVRIREGEKERLQGFEGVVIARSRNGARTTFTVRKVSYGVGVERIFPMHSPNVQSVKVLSRGKVRQSRLFYLRALSGKAARIKERAYDQSKAEEKKSAKKRRGAHRKAEARAQVPAVVTKPRKKRTKKSKTKAAE